MYASHHDQVDMSDPVTLAALDHMEPNERQEFDENLNDRDDVDSNDEQDAGLPTYFQACPILALMLRHCRSMCESLVCYMSESMLQGEEMHRAQAPHMEVR
jgi:hypothetical protein